MMDNSILIPNGGALRPNSGGVGQARMCLKVCYSVQGSLWTCSVDGNPQHDGQLHLKCQWGVHIGLLRGVVQVKMCVRYSVQVYLWTCCVDGNHTG